MSTASGRIPKYEAVAAALRERLAAMTVHEALPTERELMVDFGVSRNTVRQAIGVIVASGLVYNVQGSGTYVADPEVVSKTPRLTSFTEDMRERGLAPASRVLSCELAPAPPEVGRRLGIEEGAVLVRLRRLRLADGRPMALETVHLREDLVPIEALDPSGSIYEQLSRAGHDVQKATQTIAAVNLPVEEAKLLDQAVGAAALRVVRVGLTGREVPVEWAETIYRGDRYDFDMVVAREAS